MSIYLHAYTSLPLLEQLHRSLPYARVTSLSDAETSLEALMQLEKLVPSAPQMHATTHLLTCRHSKGRSIAWLAAHYWPAQLGAHSFFKLANGVFLSTPEFCFVQLAGILSRVELIRLGYELCSKYRLDPKTERGFEARNPLTTPHALRHFIENAPESSATTKALQALRWIAPNSASPRETATAMICALPTSLGGYELGVPRLNYLIRTQTQNRYIDLYWPERHFGLEYDSDQEHTDAHAVSCDSLREKEIELEGIQLARITNAELHSPRGRQILYQTLYKGLGKRYRVVTERYAFMRRRLIVMLLSEHRYLVEVP